jgi:hypothetical protein
VCDNTAGEGDHIVESLSGAGEIVRRRYDRATARSFGIEDVHDLLLRRWINTGYGLVEQVDRGVCGDRTSQEDPAALTTREFADLAPREIGHINASERISHRSVICGTRAAEWSKCRCASHHHHLAH